MEEYITVNPFDMTKMRTYKNVDIALNNSVKLNKSDSNHPSFLLYKTENSRIMYIGNLRRKFGTDDFFWEKKEK